MRAVAHFLRPLAPAERAAHVEPLLARVIALRDRQRPKALAALLPVLDEPQLERALSCGVTDAVLMNEFDLREMDAYLTDERLARLNLDPQIVQRLTEIRENGRFNKHVAVVPVGAGLQAPLDGYISVHGQWVAGVPTGTQQTRQRGNSRLIEFGKTDRMGMFHMLAQGYVGWGDFAHDKLTALESPSAAAAAKRKNPTVPIAVIVQAIEKVPMPFARARLMLRALPFLSERDREKRLADIRCDVVGDLLRRRGVPRKLLLDMMVNPDLEPSVYVPPIIDERVMIALGQHILDVGLNWRWL